MRNEKTEMKSRNNAWERRGKRARRERIENKVGDVEREKM